jgi:hypothetical protein
MAAAILAIATVKSGYAGLAGKTLSNLSPVGGTEVSFQKCGTLGGAVECLLQDSVALASLLELRVSDGEIYTNAHASGVFLILSSKCLTESSILDLPESTDSRALPRGFGLRLLAPGEPPQTLAA